MSAAVQQTLDDARYAAEQAEKVLLDLVIEACPGTVHRPVQHRDMLPPWCPYCGRTDRGELVGGTRG